MAILTTNLLSFFFFQQILNIRIAIDIIASYHISTICFMANIQPADSNAAIGTVISQAKAMLRKSFHETPSPPREAQPTQTTEPTLQ